MSCRAVVLALVAALAPAAPRAEESAAPANPIRAVVIRAPRDMGFFAGDIVRASVNITVAEGFALVPASLPHPGPVNYWLDLRAIDVSRHAASNGGTRYTLAVTYQDFYDALDARPQEIPSFALSFTRGDETRAAFVPAWTIGVSPLREVAPPVKDDPRDYMRADAAAPSVRTDPWWGGAAAAAGAALLALLLLLHDRAAWPFRPRRARAFGEVARAMRRLARGADTDKRYSDALLLLHRGIDRTDGRRVLADDLPGFLSRHPWLAASREGMAHFFAASRHAFFGSDPSRSRATMPFRALERLARTLAAAERTR